MLYIRVGGGIYNIRRRRGGSGDANETETRKTRLESEMSGECMRATESESELPLCKDDDNVYERQKKPRMTSHLCTSKNYTSSLSLSLYTR